VALTDLVSSIENVDIEINEHKSKITLTNKESEENIQHVNRVTNALGIEKADLDEAHT
jgi:hypothetical protein